MADDNIFQQEINANEFEQRLRQKYPKSKEVTTGPKLVADFVKANPQLSIYGAAGAIAATKGVSGYKGAVRAAKDAIQSRRFAETKAVKDLAAKGVTAIPSFAEETTEGILNAARAAAKEKLFTGFPFYNQEALARYTAATTPSVILTGESVPVSTYAVQESPLFSQTEPQVTRTVKEGEVVKVNPKRVSVETAKGIKPISTGVAEVGAAGDIGNLALANPVAPSRVGGAQAYVPPFEVNKTIAGRIARLGTEGWIGKGNVALEGIGALYDIAREGGPVREAYKEGGVPLATLAAASRAGRGSSNIMLLGLPEYTGIYDYTDLIGVERDAKKRYLELRGTAGYPAEKMPITPAGTRMKAPARTRPAIKNDKGEYVADTRPVTPEKVDMYKVPSDSPYLYAIEGNLAAQRGIPASALASDWYKGPEYTYYVDSNGQLQTRMMDYYAAREEAQNQAVIANAMRYKPMFNLDPNQGALGMPMNRSRAFDVGEYVDYMRQ